MPPPPAPEQGEVAAALRRVVTRGLASAQDESLAPVQAVLDVVRGAARETLGLKQLLERAIARCRLDDATKDALPIMFDLDRTGEAAKERYQRVADALILAFNTVATDKRTAWCDLLAAELLAMHREACDQLRGRFEVDERLRERFEALCTIAALQLAALRRPDGSWAAVPTDDAGELSTTSRAAASLHKALGGEWAGRALETTLDWIDAHHDELRGAYGDFHQPAAPAGFRKDRQIVGQPRQTASAIKILRQFEGPRFRRVGLGVKYLIEHQAHDRTGWAATGHRDDPADVLTTAYVLDALLMVQPDLRHLDAVLDKADFQAIDEQFDIVVRRGVDGLVDRCRDGGWSIDDEAPDPYVTAQVLGFAWQVVVPRPDATIAYLMRLCHDGGVPMRTGGPPEVAPTAMALLGLLRATSDGHEELLGKGAAYLGRAAEAADVELDVFAATFALLLGQPAYDWLSGDAWQERARGGVEAIFAGARDGATPAEAAEAAVAELEVGHRRIQPVLERTLELHA